MKFLRWVICLLLIAVTANALTVNNGKAEFLAKGKPGFIRIAGKGTTPYGEIQIQGQKLSGRISVDLRKLETGIKLRDEHMKNKYLEVEKYPEAVFAFENIELPTPLTELSEKSLDIVGPFTLHGVTKPITARVSFIRENSSLIAKANFEINIQDYNIQVPSFSGVTVAREVQVHVETQITLP